MRAGFKYCAARTRDVLFTIGLTVLFLAGCKPPATDEYVDRAGTAESDEFASHPIDSPDTSDAVWVDSNLAGRIIYGEPGETPLFALACEIKDGQRQVHITRFSAADPQATALIALVGNGHTSRLPIDATWNGKVWLWEGYYPADALDLDVLTGPRRVEATIPGAGSVILNASQRPARLIETCREPVTQNSGPE